VGYVARVCERKEAYRVLMEKLEGMKRLGRRRDRRIILKMIIKT
jgi:hypothetical protein